MQHSVRQVSLITGHINRSKNRQSIEAPWNFDICSCSQLNQHIFIAALYICLFSARIESFAAGLDSASKFLEV